MTKDEARAIRHLLRLAHGAIVFDLELAIAFSTLRETYGLAELLLMVEEVVKADADKART
jgi:hypothetical protein